MQSDAVLFKRHNFALCHKYSITMTDPYQQAALREFEIAATDITSAKAALPALAKSMRRFDNLIAKAIDDSPTKPACKAGCSYCCYYKVEVKAHELLLIHDHMQKHFAPATIAQVLDEAATNAELIRSLTPEQHLTRNIKCPLLVNNQCSVYQVRPYKCRNFHAVDVSGCEQSFNDPASMSITSGLIESVAMFGDAHSQGFEAAAARKGLDARSYDLNTGLLAVFSEKNAFKRFQQGKTTFPTAIQVADD